MSATHEMGISPPFYFECSLDSFDEFEETIEGWDVETCPLDRKPFRGHLIQYGDVQRGILCTHARYNVALRQQGMPPAGMRTLSIGARPDFSMDWRRQEVNGSDIAIFPEGGELDAFTSSTFDVFVLSVSPVQLMKAAEALGYVGLVEKISGDEVLRCDPSSMQALRMAFGSVQSVFASASNPQAAIEDLQRWILRALASSVRAPRQTPVRLRERAAREAEAFLRQHARDLPTVRSLCELTGASDRTLEHGFRERFGVTPKRYLNTIRLNEVRMTLRDSDPQTTVIADIANEWGFWHMGQFAAEYRNAFGERPSETLACGTAGRRGRMRRSAYPHAGTSGTSLAV